MPTVTNAKAGPDLKAAKRFIASLGKAAKDRSISIHFEPDEVTVEDEGEQTTLSRSAFGLWAEAGFPYRNHGPDLNAIKANSNRAEPEPIRPQPKPQPKAKAKRSKPAKKPARKAPEKKAPAKKAAPPPPPPEPEPKPKRSYPVPVPPSDDLIDELAHSAFEIAGEEYRGDHGRNVARFMRGELMLKVDSLAKSTRTSAKRLLAQLNERALVLADQEGVPDFKVITEGEMATTKAVVGAFGSSGEFNLIDHINPVTGQPLMRDDGNPFQMPITEVALNKLYPLVEYAGEADFDTLMSFAYRNTERVVKMAKRVAKAKGKPIKAVIRDINKLRVKVTSPLDASLGEVSVQPGEAEAMDALREMVGEAPTSEVATIKTDRAWFDNTWVPLKAFMSHVARLFNPNLVNQTSGEVTNVYVLERTLTQLFGFNLDPSQAAQRTLLAMIEAGDITQKNAESFLNRFVLTEEGTWVETGEGAGLERDAQTAGIMDEDEEDEGFGLEDPDLDEGDEEEPSEDEDEGFE